MKNVLRAEAGEIYILHHLGFLVRWFRVLGAVEPLPMLNMPGVDALNVGGAFVVPKLMDGVVDEAEKLKPVAGFEVVAVNWKGADTGATTLLLPAKEKLVIFCCDGFWFAPKVNIPVVVLFVVFALPVPNADVEHALGAPKADEA